MASKKSSAAPRRRLPTLEEFSVETINPGKWTRLSSFAGSCVDFPALFNKVGWTKFVEMKNTWYHEPYAFFWDSAKEVDGTLVGNYEDHTIVISAKDIAVASGCKTTGKIFSNEWEKEFQEAVDEVLYSTARPAGGTSKEVTHFLRAANMKPVYRLLHNFLFHIFFPRMGSKDNVTRRDRFCLFNFAAEKPMNLPQMIMEFWLGALKAKDHSKKPSSGSVPYGMLFARILKIKNLKTDFRLERLQIYPPGEEITLATVNKMHIADQIFPPVKEEPLEEVVGASYRVGSIYDPNAPDADGVPSKALPQKLPVKRQTKDSSDVEPVVPIKVPHKARTKRPLSPTKPKPPSKPQTQAQTQASKHQPIPPHSSAQLASSVESDDDDMPLARRKKLRTVGASSDPTPIASSQPQPSLTPAKRKGRTKTQGSKKARLEDEPRTEKEEKKLLSEAEKASLAEAEEQARLDEEKAKMLEEAMRISREEAIRKAQASSNSDAETDPEIHRILETPIHQDFARHSSMGECSSSHHMDQPVPLQMIRPSQMTESDDQTMKSNAADANVDDSVVAEEILETESVREQTIKSAEEVATNKADIPVAESEDQTMKQADVFALSVFADQTESSETLQAEPLNVSAPPDEVSSQEGPSSSAAPFYGPEPKPFSPEKEKWKLPIRYRRTFLVKTDQVEAECTVVLPPSSAIPSHKECLPCLQAAMLAASDPFKTWNAPPAPHDSSQDSSGVETEPPKRCEWCAPENSGSLTGSIHDAARSESPWNLPFPRKIGSAFNDVEECQFLEVLHNLSPWSLRHLHLPGLDPPTLISFDKSRFVSSASSVSSPSADITRRVSSSSSAPSTPPSGMIFHYGLKPRLKVPAGCFLWSNQSILDPMLPIPVPLNKVEYLSLCHTYRIVFPWNRHAIAELPRLEPLSLIPSESPSYKFWSLHDKSDDLFLKMANLHHEHRQALRAHQKIALHSTATSHNAPTFLGSPFPCVLKPQTKLRLAMSKGYQVLTQKVAKGKEIDLSDNPTVFPRRPQHLYPEEIAKFFEKGYANLEERFLLWNQGENLKFWSGIYPQDKIRGKEEDAAYDVGQLGEGPSSAYSSRVDNLKIILPPPKIIYSTAAIPKTLIFTFAHWILVLRPERLPTVAEFNRLKERNEELEKVNSKFQKLCARLNINYDDL